MTKEKGITLRGWTLQLCVGYRYIHINNFMFTNDSLKYSIAREVSIIALVYSIFTIITGERICFWKIALLVTNLEQVDSQPFIILPKESSTRETI